MNKLAIFAIGLTLVLGACSQQTQDHAAATTDSVITDTQTNVSAVAIEADQAAQNLQETVATDPAQPADNGAVVAQSAEARVPSDQQY